MASIVVPGIIRIRFKGGRLPKPQDWFAFLERKRKNYPEQVSGDGNTVPDSWDILMFVRRGTEDKVIGRLLEDPVVESAIRHTKKLPSPTR